MQLSQNPDEVIDEEKSGVIQLDATCIKLRMLPYNPFRCLLLNHSLRKSFANSKKIFW